MLRRIVLNPRRLLPLLGILILLVAPTRSVAAHPLGNFTINLYSRLEVGAEQIDIVYVVDMAEIPTYQEFGGGALNAGEHQDYLQQKAQELQANLQLTVDGLTPDLQIVRQKLAFPEGQGGLLTTRIELGLAAELPRLAAGKQRNLTYEDTNYLERLGWHEVVVRPASGVELARSDAPAEDQSNELRAYPEDMLLSPPDIRTANATVELGGAQTVPGQTNPLAPWEGGQDGARTTDRFAALIATEQLDLSVQLVALLIALGLGTVHALSPGHGKTIVGAYLVGTRGTARHAFFLGLTVTITHTLGVFALGLVTLYASRYILPEQLYPWLGVLSGVMIVVMGLLLFSQRLRAVRGSSVPAHDHDHSGYNLDHEHGPNTHTHLPPGTNGSRVTWSSLLALGISGGLIPCPSALIVMLSAISLGRIGFGLLLISAFSVGLAGALTGIGLLFVYGSRWIGRLSGGRLRAPGLRLVPVASALFVTTAGVIITAQAIAQAGLLR